jgi:hypothetical protein
VPFGGNEADHVLTANETDEVRVTLEELDFVGSATLVAVTVTVVCEVIEFGAA